MKRHYVRINGKAGGGTSGDWMRRRIEASHWWAVIMYWKCGDPSVGGWRPRGKGREEGTLQQTFSSNIWDPLEFIAGLKMLRF